MKKILILNWRDPKHPNAGGAEQATLKHILAWQKAGYDITWFSSFVKNLQEEEVYQGIRIIRKGYFVFGVQLFAFLHLLSNKYDLVIDQIHGLPFFTPLYLLRTPKIAFIHEVSKEVVWHNPYPFPINKIIGLIASLVEPLVFFCFYRNILFMTVSKSTKQELQEWGVKNITVIENGVTLPKILKKYKKNKQRTITYLGALAKDKGVEDAILVFNKLAISHKDWKFWVVGKSDENYIKQLKLIADKRIKFLGFVSESKKFELLSKSHILVNPSLREGWGLVNIEANSVGTPVVGFDVAGIRDSVKHNETGILVKTGNVKEMVEEIEKLLENGKKYNVMSKNAYLWSSQFNWIESGRQSLSYLQEVLASKS